MFFKLLQGLKLAADFIPIVNVVVDGVIIIVKKIKNATRTK
jgi:hypothetical protein